MRKISEIIVHCSGTAEGQDFHIEDIDRWHRQKGWCGVGYHYVVCLDGTVEGGRPEAAIGAHCYGHNMRSIGVCYVGGVDKDGKPKDTRTDAQRAALRSLVQDLLHRYPGATVHGHCEFASKACPSFDVLELTPLRG